MKGLKRSEGSLRASRARAPPGSLLVTLLGAMGGALIGVLVLAAAFYSQDRSAGFRAAVLQAWPSAAAPGLPVDALVIGAILGFLLVGVLVRNRLVLSVLTGTGRVLTVLAGAAVGAVAGAVVYIAVWLIENRSHDVAAALAGWRDTIGYIDDALTLFVLVGMLIGLAGATYVAGHGQFRRGIGLVAGVIAGGVAAIVAHSVAWVLLHGAPAGQPVEVARAMVLAADAGGPTEILFAVLGAYIGGALARYRWRLYGLLTFLSLTFVVLGYMLYTLTTTLPAVPPADRMLSIALFAAEIASLLMVLLYSFYTIDVAARKHWARTTALAPFSSYFLPKVAIQVPTYNEPPEMVKETLRHLLAIDYPVDRYTIVVGDDSTKPECYEPLRDFCQANGIAYLRRNTRTGYKAGVLNALLRWIPPEYTILAVVDADYQVEPEFLRETVGYFADGELGWLQTPQDYRNRDESFLTKQYYLADAYFYRTILPSRNEENTIIFCGTMGLLRRRAVEEVGAWGEAYITEDAELSARLLNAGWKSQYVNKTYGRGLIPSTFEGYKRQHYRWAFGGGRILRGHGLRFLFGRFTFRQRLDYLVGTLNWFEGAFILAIAIFVFAMGVADLAGNDVLTHHNGEVLLVGLVPIFLLLDGLTRVHLVLRRSVHLSFGGTLRLMGMWSSVKFSNMRAAMLGLLGFKIPFIRTSKKTMHGMGRLASLGRAIRLTPFESGFAFLMAVTSIIIAVRQALSPLAPQTVGRWFLSFWLAYYALVFSAAPLYAYKSFVTLARAPTQLPSRMAPDPPSPPSAHDPADQERAPPAILPTPGEADTTSPQGVASARPPAAWAQAGPRDENEQEATA